LVISELETEKLSALSAFFCRHVTDRLSRAPSTSAINVKRQRGAREVKTRT